uniref:Probable palmitoyltransferase ZDHHC1 n=1 Tax=Sinocyclocheilus rhinocerous TaxID=307959 RepID=A0A673M922_9TELE
MDVCSKNSNRTAPVSEGVPRRADVPLCSRTNGWSWPPHPFQLLAWMLYLYFAVTGFGVFVPLIPTHWIPAGYIFTGITFVCHLFMHLMAVSIDPADYNVRAKSYKGPMPVFDRTKHAHVIENCHCYLCEVDVGPKSKHCSPCNKCVASFDHHFVFTSSSLSLIVWVRFFSVLSFPWTDGSCVKLFRKRCKIQIKHFILYRHFVSDTVSFSPLVWNKLSTYEYIVLQRHRQEAKDSRKPLPEHESGVPTINLIKQVSYGGTLGYTNPEMEVEDPTAMSSQEGSARYGNGRVRGSSEHLGEEELLPAVLTENKASPHPHKHTQKKKRKVRKLAAEVNSDRSIDTGTTKGMPKTSAEQESSVAASTVSSSIGQRLPFPAFPLRSSLPPLAPVQAAGPPAEYHSDSAESLEEIPVAMARLGSAALAGTTNAAMSASSYSSSLQCALPSSAAGQALPSPQPRTKRKAAVRKAAEQRFEMVSHNPSMFVSRECGEPAMPLEGIITEESPRVAKRKQTGTKRNMEDTKPSTSVRTLLA